MPNVLYVGLQDADKIAMFAIDDAGKLTKQGEMPAPRRPIGDGGRSRPSDALCRSAWRPNDHDLPDRSANRLRRTNWTMPPGAERRCARADDPQLIGNLAGILKVSSTG